MGESKDVSIAAIHEAAAADGGAGAGAAGDCEP